MLDWTVNPYGVDFGAYVILWITLLVIVPPAVIVGIAKVIASRHRERGTP